MTKLVSIGLWKICLRSCFEKVFTLFVESIVDKVNSSQCDFSEDEGVEKNFDDHQLNGHKGCAKHLSHSERAT